MKFINASMIISLILGLFYINCIGQQVLPIFNNNRLIMIKSPNQCFEAANIEPVYLTHNDSPKLRDNFPGIFIAELISNKIDTVIADIEGGKEITIYEYGAANKLTSVTSYINTTGQWVNSLRITYTLNSRSDRLSETLETGEGNVWNKMSKSIFEYDDYGNNTSYTWQSWEGGEWQNIGRTNLTYYSSGLIEQQLSELWESGSWKNISRVTYTYTLSDLYESHFVENWVDGSWKNSEKKTYTYDAQDNCTLFLDEIWQNEEWVNNSQLISTYDASGYVLTQLYQLTKNNVWENNYFAEFSYTSGYGVHTQTNMTWNNNQWVNKSKSIKEYDSRGNFISFVSQTANISGWENSGRTTYSYNDQNSLLSFLNEYWENSQWQALSRMNLSYNEVGNLCGIVNEQFTDGQWQPYDFSYTQRDIFDNDFDFSGNNIEIIYKGLTSPPDAPLLLIPEDGAAGTDYMPELTWAQIDNADNYHIQISENPQFTSLVFDSACIAGTSIIVVNLQSSKKYYWRCCAANKNGEGNWSAAWQFTTGLTTRVEENETIPIKFELSQNYPNPFNPTTTIKYYVARVETGRAPSLRHVTLEIFDVLGREVAALVDEYLPAGNYTKEWNASELPSGIYFCRMEAGSYKSSIKLLLLK